MSVTNLRDWPGPESAPRENGRYYNTCAVCGEQFLGSKRRAVCKCCDSYLKRVDAPQVQEGR
jgi:hypothetical protein